jgi:hypothetical protein
MGFELKIVVLDETLDLARSLENAVGYSTMVGICCRGRAMMGEIATSLSISGIGVHHFHVEMKD